MNWWRVLVAHLSHPQSRAKSTIPWYFCKLVFLRKLSTHTLVFSLKTISMHNYVATKKNFVLSAHLCLLGKLAVHLCFLWVFFWTLLLLQELSAHSCFFGITYCTLVFPGRTFCLLVFPAKTFCTPVFTAKTHCCANSFSANAMVLAGRTALCVDCSNLARRDRWNTCSGFW